MRARRCGDRSRGEAECVSVRESDAENCDERNHDDMAHSRFVGPEIELICNHNFV
jgi:hypothetical protein